MGGWVNKEALSCHYSIIQKALLYRYQIMSYVLQWLSAMNIGIEFILAWISHCFFCCCCCLFVCCWFFCVCHTILLKAQKLRTLNSSSIGSNFSHLTSSRKLSLLQYCYHIHFIHILSLIKTCQFSKSPISYSSHLWHCVLLSTAG